MKKPCKDCNPFCHSLDTDTRELLCEHVTVTYQKPKQIESNQWSEQLAIIAEGLLLTFVFLEDGSQKSIEFLKDGDILGTHLLNKNIQYPDYQTVALTEVKKCNIPLKVIEKLFHNNLPFAQALLQNITQLHARNSICSVNMNSKKGEEKVEYVYESLKNANIDMGLITQEDIALMAGVSRITVARAMKHINKEK